MEVLRVVAVLLALGVGQGRPTKMQYTNYDYKPGVNFIADYLASSLEAMKAVNESRKIEDAENGEE